MADNATATETANEWNDPVHADTLFTPLVKGVFWAGYGILAVSLAVISVLMLVVWFDATKEATGIPAGLDMVMVFGMVNSLGAIVFTSGLVLASLLSARTAAWARITMLSVAAVILVGSNALGTFFLGSLPWA